MLYCRLLVPRRVNKQPTVFIRRRPIITFNFVRENSCSSNIFRLRTFNNNNKNGEKRITHGPANRPNYFFKIKN